MNYRNQLVGLVLTALSAPGLSKEPAPLLHVMLQGENSAIMAALVNTHGGTLTHDLPIINSVGATLSREQLERILATDKVSRYIDDLSMDGEETEEETADCQVAGSLEAKVTPEGISWPLFNKGDAAVTLSEVQAAWPDNLGPLRAVSLAGYALPARLWKGQTGHAATLTPGPGGISLPAGMSELTLQFSEAVPSEMVQREFTLEAQFGADCSTKLVPGYHDNHENFYYAQVSGASDLHLHGVTGAGITVAVLDSGLWEHPALANDTAGRTRIRTRYDAIDNLEGEPVFDASGHGTHMTSVIAHSGPVTQDGRPIGSFQGVAPDAQLVPVRAFNVEGQGDMLDIVRGVQWVVANREAYDIRILNLSFAARPRWPYYLDPINQAVMQAWQAGIVVVAAAGNEGPEPMTVGSPGNLPYVITVGAVTDSWTLNTRDDDYVPDFSSRGPTPDAHIKPDVVAPGGHITGITRPGSSLTKDYPEYLLQTGEFVMTGSSQAAALVSGVAALLLQMDPKLSPDDVKCMLLSSAEPAINADGLLAYSPFQQGHGYVSATRAITLGERGCGNADMDITLDLSGERHYQGPATVNKQGEVSLPGLENLLSPQAPAAGHSDTRKWGVKEHLERENPTPNSDPNHPFDWPAMYEAERARIERLATEPPQ